jgi:NAD(P)H-dependent FMN reductase
VKFLTVTGSLRSSSSNTTLLRALPLVAPEHEFTFPSPLDSIPFFNPDVEQAALPTSVQRWREAIRTNDALVICSPEYAHGVPGVLKNALDWLVGGVEVVDKPIAVINTSLPSTVAHASLLEILSVMGGRILPEASLAVVLRGRKLDERGMASDPVLSPLLRTVVTALASAVSSTHAS